jgi:hypothetical protein
MPPLTLGMELTIMYKKKAHEYNSVCETVGSMYAAVDTHTTSTVIIETRVLSNFLATSLRLLASSHKAAISISSIGPPLP